MIDQTAEALTYFGNRAVEQGNDALARWLYEEGLTIWRALDFQPGIAHLLERLERLDDRQEERPAVHRSRRLPHPSGGDLTRRGSPRCLRLRRPRTAFPAGSRTVTVPG